MSLYYNFTSTLKVLFRIAWFNPRLDYQLIFSLTKIHLVCFGGWLAGAASFLLSSKSQNVCIKPFPWNWGQIMHFENIFKPKEVGKVYLNFNSTTFLSLEPTLHVQYHIGWVADLNFSSWNSNQFQIWKIYCIAMWKKWFIVCWFYF